MVSGAWLVVGKRAYRGHDPGTEFEASIPAAPAKRALVRGDIRLLEEFVPAPPAEHQLPEGWV